MPVLACKKKMNRLLRPDKLNPGAGKGEQGRHMSPPPKEKNRGNSKRNQILFFYYLPVTRKKNIEETEYQIWMKLSKSSMLDWKNSVF